MKINEYDFITDKDGPRGVSIKSWLEKEKIALLMNDIQNFCTYEKYSGTWSSDGNDNYFFSRAKDIVFPNIKKILKRFRGLNLQVVYTRLASMEKNLADIPGIAKKVLAEELFDAKGTQYHLYYDEFDSMIDDKVKPQPEDIEIIKTSSGAFCSSNIDLILRNINVSRLIVVGGLTDACIASTVRGAYDRGYLCTVIDDACITATQEDHDAAMRSLDKYYGWVTNTEELLKNLK